MGHACNFVFVSQVIIHLCEQSVFIIVTYCWRKSRTFLLANCVTMNVWSTECQKLTKVWAFFLLMFGGKWDKYWPNFVFRVIMFGKCLKLSSRIPEICQAIWYCYLNGLNSCKPINALGHYDVNLLFCFKSKNLVKGLFCS